MYQMLATQVLHHTKSAAAGKLLDRRKHDHAEAEHIYHKCVNAKP